MISRPKTIVISSVAGLSLALIGAWAMNRSHKPQPPAFAPAANPYANAIYASGMIESAQSSGENVNINPEVSGPVVKVFVREGDVVRAGQPLFMIDDTVQRATAQQLTLQADAAQAMLNELKAEPRNETLAVTRAQLDQAQANLVTSVDQRDKIHRSFEIDPRSVSRQTLDTAEDTVKAAQTGVDVARRQLELTKAGAWVYDVQNQARQYKSLSAAADASQALLDKYVVKAAADGVVLALNAPLGGYVSPQGTYDTYTEATVPVAVMGAQGAMNVRVYVDEILLSRLPLGDKVKAEMIVRGSDAHVPLRFVRVQPYVTPKIELSDERQERVDLRVLPVIFQFAPNPKLKLYPGQLVDVYISEQ